MPYYESVFIARQDVGAGHVDTIADEFAGILEEGGGKVTKREYWGLRNLAYRIKKNRKGHYVLMNIDAPAPAVLELERRMRLNEDVLRFMTLRVEELEEGQSVMMQKREERRDRGDRDRGDRGDRDRGERGDRGGERRRADGESDDKPRAEAKAGDEAQESGEAATTKTEGDE